MKASLEEPRFGMLRWKPLRRHSWSKMMGGQWWKRRRLRTEAVLDFLLQRVVAWAGTSVDEVEAVGGLMNQIQQ